MMAQQQRWREFDFASSRAFLRPRTRWLVLFTFFLFSPSLNHPRISFHHHQHDCCCFVSRNQSKLLQSQLQIVFWCSSTLYISSRMGERESERVRLYKMSSDDDDDAVNEWRNVNSIFSVVRRRREHETHTQWGSYTGGKTLDESFEN